MASTMQLEFAQAMSDFKTMFPEMDKEVIEAVLRANQGAVDATIDQLLAMSTDNQNERLRNELDQPIGGTPNKTLLNSITASPPAGPVANLIDDIDGVHHTSLMGTSPSLVSSTGASPKIKKGILTSSSQNASPMRGAVHSGIAGCDTVETLPLRVQRKWNPPMLGPLPPGFLRLTSSELRSEYDIPDEQFALMLQNEEFMNELRWNQEFMLALEKEQAEKGRGEDDAVFRERLKHMGKKSRKKFLQLARVFTWQRNKKPGAVRHPDSLLLQEEHSDDDEPKKSSKK